jgi:hypothetical protein
MILTINSGYMPIQLRRPIVTVKCGVLFEVRTEFLNNI